MKTNQTQCLLETWQPEPTEKLVREIPVKEGKTLPNSVTEDVLGMGIMPQYSRTQLCRIHKKQRQYSESLMTNTLASGGMIQW